MSAGDITTTVIVHEDVLSQQHNGSASADEDDMVEETECTEEIIESVECAGGDVLIVKQEEIVLGDVVVGSEEPDIINYVQEEVVLSSAGVQVSTPGGAARHETADRHSGHGGRSVVQLREEDFFTTPSSETEMSVAMDLANLSQGHFPNGSTWSSPASANTSLTSNASTPGSMEKPRLSYAQLIAEALLSAGEERMLTLSEIYQAISRKYPFYRMDLKTWQNAIRHNLTLNPSFKKVPRPSSEGRGNYWRIEDGAERVIFRRALKQHHYNRARKSNPNNAPVAGVLSGGNGLTTTTTIVVQDSDDVHHYEVEEEVEEEEVETSGAASDRQRMEDALAVQTITLDKQYVPQNGQVILIALPSEQSSA